MPDVGDVDISPIRGMIWVTMIYMIRLQKQSSLQLAKNQSKLLSTSFSASSDFRLPPQSRPSSSACKASRITQRFSSSAEPGPGFLITGVEALGSSPFVMTSIEVLGDCTFGLPSRIPCRRRRSY